MAYVSKLLLFLIVDSKIGVSVSLSIFCYINNAFHEDSVIKFAKYLQSLAHANEFLVFSHIAYNKIIMGYFAVGMISKGLNLTTLCIFIYRSQ